MAVNITNGLFPPYVESFMPAFINTEDARIYFSISPYNSADDIQLVHVSLTSQLTNENALKSSTGIYISTLNFDDDKQLYYVDIPRTAVGLVGSDGNWLINQYYKVQIRFDKTVSQATEKNAAYFINNLENFSEWSTICLIRAIKQPNIYLKLFDTGTEEESQVVTFNKGILPLTGGLFFDEANSVETETLQFYQIQIIDTFTDSVLLESDKIYTAGNVNPNEIVYRFDIQGLDTSTTSNFILRVIYSTRNLYESYKDYKFAIADYVADESFNPTITLSEDNDNGIVKVHIENPNSVFGTLYIKRASNLTNYKVWEDIHVQRQAGIIDLEIEDNTVGSMVWYIYSVQLENSKGALTQPTYSSKVMLDFYDAIISRADKQVAIRYNYKISSFKPVVNRVKVDTIGSKYPRFLQNAEMNYKQFSITGLLSAQADYDEKFLDKSETLNEYNNYTIYNDNNRVTDYYDYYWEREFRERLVAWLNDGEPKLYRSQTEGNIAIIISDITLTPNSTLSRRIWDFSATCYEIEDGNSLSTLESLGIYEVARPSAIDDSDTPIDYTIVTKPGQIYMIGTSTFQKNDVINNYIAINTQEKYVGILEDKDPQDYQLSDVKIIFHSKPHLFVRLDNNRLQLITDTNIGAYDSNNFVLGYTFSLSDSTDNSKLFFVNERGYYEVPDNIEVQSIYFPQTDDIVTINYIVEYKEKNSGSSIISSRTLEKTVVGQESRTFMPGERIGESIRKKYFYTIPNDFYQKMDSWRGISIDTIPRTVVKIMYQNSQEWVNTEIGLTGHLNLIKNVPVNNIEFVGRHLHEIPTSRIDYADEWDFAVDTNTYNTLENILFPKVHMVYNVAGTDYIYYLDGHFYLFDKEKDIAEVPVNASVNFVGDIIRSSFQ